MATHEITLDVTKKEITPQVIHTRVGDSNATIKATVTNDGAAYSLSGATVKFKAAKPDGTYAEQPATVSGSTATVTLAPEFLAVPGIIKTAYFEITASGKKDTTGNVWIDNRADAEGEAPDLSTSYIPTVDQLVEDATEALNSANTALGNAEEALEDAEAATDSATDAAASANAAANAAQSAIDAMTGNVLRGTVGPSEVVGVEDAYPQVPLGVKVKGLTRQNLWANPTGTQYGVTIKENGDGTVTMSGTATSTVAIVLRSYILKPGASYTFSIDNAMPSGTVAYISTAASDGSGYVETYANASGSQFTVGDDKATFYFGIRVNSGSAVSGTYRIMLNEGSEAEPWCPPGLNSVEGLEIAQSPANMWPSKSSDYKDISNDLTIGEDGWLSFSIDNSAGSSTKYCNLFSKPIKGIGIGDDLWMAVEYDGVNAATGIQISNGSYDYVQFNGSFITSITAGSGKSVGKVTCGRNYGTWVSVGVRTYLSVSAGAKRSGRIRVGLYRTEEEANAAWTPSEAPKYTSVNLNSNALRSLPDGTCDVLEIVEDGTAGIEKAVGHAVYDGDESWVYANSKIGRDGGAPGSTAIAGSSEKAMCDTLPIGQMSTTPAINSYESGYVDIRNDAAITSAESGKAWLAANPTTYDYKLKETTAVSLPAVTLPSLPGPTANVWAVATDGHGNTLTLQPEIELEYARDVTLVIGSLEAKVAALELLHETE